MESAVVRQFEIKQGRTTARAVAYSVRG